MFNRNIVFPSLIILLSAIAFAVITQFAKPMYQDASVDARFFPMVIVIIQIILCIILIVQHRMKKSQEKEEPLFTKMSLFGILFILGYIILISIIGYLFASISAFLFYLVYFKIKKPSYYVAALIFVFSVYYLFGEVFYIYLPEAIWS